MHARRARTLLGARWRGMLWGPVLSVVGLRPALPRVLRLRRWSYRRQILAKGTHERAAICGLGETTAEGQGDGSVGGCRTRESGGKSLPEPARAGRRDLSTALTASTYANPSSRLSVISP